VKYNLKLNPGKCVFGVEARKFLGFLLNEKGIRGESQKMREMRSPTNVREVQHLTRHMVVLSRFLWPVETNGTTTSNVLRRTTVLCGLVNARKLSPS